MSDYGLAELQERVLAKQIEAEIAQGRLLKVCPRCGWSRKTNLIFCWNFRRVGDPNRCVDDNGQHQRLEVAQ